MKKLISKYRHRGAHRVHRPGPLPRRPATDPWAGHELLPLDSLVTHAARG